MKSWDPQRLALASGAAVLQAPSRGAGGPERVTIDSRDAGPGALFVGLPGERAHGGSFAAAALGAGVWGVLTDKAHAAAAAAGGAAQPQQVVLGAEEPLIALQGLATAWRRELGARVVGVTGSTGKTSTKDLLLAVLAPHRRTVASRANFNTEIGLPLELLAAAAGTEVVVLEMAMRGAGQIAELARIEEPDLGVIVSVGPVHLELLGTLEAIAAAKAELIVGLPPGATIVVPAHEPLLEAHLRPDLRTVTFGPGGDVRLLPSGADGSDEHVEIDAAGERISLHVTFTQPHLRRNLLAAVAAARALGVTPRGGVEFTPGAGRGRRIELPGGVLLIDDCYNANPMSMRAALDDLAAIAARMRSARRVAVLGDMLELGPGAPDFHLQLARAAAASADLLVTVGPLAGSIASGFPGEVHRLDDAAVAAAVVPGLLRAGDVVLVKGSFAVGLSRLCAVLTEGVAA